MLKITNLKKIYHTPQEEIEAINNFSLDLKENEFIALVGPSGCGKSTILKILSGLEKASDGNIEIDKNIKLGYMLQEDSLFDWLTIKENCLLGLKIQNILTKENENNVIRLLETYGLKEFINSYPKNLSGGMRQRVALIRTLAINPDILLLDEPFSALDYQSRLAVSDDVYKIIKKENKTAIMVTHNISESITMANKVIILSDRPSTIKKVIDINLTNKTTPINNRKCIEFDKYYDEIWKEIDFNV